MPEYLTSLCPGDRYRNQATPSGRYTRQGRFAFDTHFACALASDSLPRSRHSFVVACKADIDAWAGIQCLAFTA